MRIRFLLLLIPILFILTSCQEPSSSHSSAVNGKLTLTEEDFTINESIPLNGEWKFFWKELLNENEINNRLIENNQANMLVPSNWEDSLGTSLGYGTYFLKVIIPQEKVGNTLAFTTSHQNTSYTLFVNGVRIASNGFVGSSAKTSEPEYSNRLVYFTPRSKELNIVLHVSNYVHPVGGASNPILIGTAEQLTISHSDTLAYTMFTIGGILVMGIYELVIFFFRRKEIVFLYFGLISVLISIYTIVKPPFFFNKIFPTVDWLWVYRIEIICIYALFLFYLLFVRAMYPQEMKKIPTIVGVIIAIFCIMYTLLQEPLVFRPLLNTIFLIMMLYIIYGTYVLILAFIRKRPTARINLIAILIYFVTVLNDVLLTLNWIDSISLSTSGFFLYVLIQSINLSRDYARKFEEAEKLSSDLQVLNVSLDEKIKERTEELKHKNEKLKQLTLVDGLTGIYNRRYFDEYMSKYFAESFATSSPLSLLMIDIDNFKLYNDNKGHIAGDELLKKSSQLLNEMFNGNRFIARYGGEEFAVVLPNTTIQRAIEIAEDIRLLIEEQKFSLGIDNNIVTISIGASSTEQHAFKQKEELIDRADKALYQSKKNGKNRVTLL
ncbi:diguanylate cyclase [Psychrobacillus sp. FJAT-51614]|uniref:Diguanylate cyclase n=1 Tax=Psychrobacillus mangrovi TaxID=3117745 RepID=A0ABU8F1W7_9BACI